MSFQDRATIAGYAVNPDSPDQVVNALKRLFEKELDAKRSQGDQMLPDKNLVALISTKTHEAGSPITIQMEGGRRRSELSTEDAATIEELAKKFIVSVIRSYAEAAGSSTAEPTFTKSSDGVTWLIDTGLTSAQLASALLERQRQTARPVVRAPG